MEKKITVYSTSTCGYCIRLKQYLNEHQINFENFDVAQDQAKAEEMIQKSGQMGVPVIDIDGEIIIGFDRERIANKLGL